MLNFLRLLVSIFVILLLFLQTPKYNIVKQALYSTGLLANYGEVKRFINALNWFSIFLFLIIEVFASLT